MASLIINIPQHNGSFVTIDESTVTHHYHPKSVVYVRVHSGGAHSIGLDRCIVTGICPYGIIQSIFTALKILCANDLFFFLNEITFKFQIPSFEQT